jgi:hypothetical protein
MKHLKTFESFLNEAKDSVTFSVNDEKLDQLLHDFHERELDYVKVKGDDFYSLPKREFDRFIAAADSKGFGEEDWSYYEESVNPIRESQSLEGYDVSGISRQDLKTVLNFLDLNDIDYSFDGNKEILDFDMTELDKKGQDMMKKLGIKESINEAKSESGLMVFGKTNLDNNKIGDWLDDSDYTAEWNAREGYWLFPEEEDGYDALEAELEKAFTKARINARFEGIF